MDLKNYTASGTLSTNSLLSINGLLPSDLMEILSECARLGQKEEYGESIDFLKGKNYCLITSNRLGASRLAFEIAVSSLGAKPVTLALGGSNVDDFISTKESVKAISKLNISGFFVGTKMQKDAFVLSEYLKIIPVINSNIDDSPVYALAILLSVYERIGRLFGIKVCFLGNTEKHAEVFKAFSKCGADISVFTPNEKEELLSECKQFSEIMVCDDAINAVKNADVIFVDGETPEYYLTEELYSTAKEGCPIYHSVPAANAPDLFEDCVEHTENCTAEAGANIMKIERAIISLLSKTAR